MSIAAGRICVGVVSAWRHSAVKLLVSTIKYIKVDVTKIPHARLTNENSNKSSPRPYVSSFFLIA